MYSTLDGQRKTKYEIRKAADHFAPPFFVVLFSFLVCSAGCQGIDREQPPAPVNDTPLVVDEAMQIRDWDRSTNYYANGATVAGGTGYVWEVADWANPGHRRFIDAPVAVLNIVSMPVGIFVNSPFGEQVYRGETVPPTYTGQPPLPGEPVPVNRAEPEMVEPVPPPSPTEPPPAPPAIETPPPPIDSAPPPPPTPPPAPTEPPPAPITPTEPPPAPAPSDPITPAPAPPAPESPPPSAVEPAPPVTPVTPAPPEPSAPPTPPVAPPPQ
jgi:hypothetical protein